MATTWKDITKTKLTQSDWSLLVANLLPVVGVWFFGWSAQEVFLVYCLETIIIGIFSLLKMLITGLIKKKDDWQTTGGATIKQPFWFFMFFFLIHYGFFVAIQMGLFFSVSGIGDQHGITLSNFFSKWPSLLTNNAYIMLGVFIVSYLMFQPYGRIFVQQVTVILGSMLLSFGAGKIFILVFALIKIFFEVFIDFDFLLRKAAKGELKGSGEK